MIAPKKAGVVAALFVMALARPAASAQYNVDPNASVVYLRTTCTEGSSPAVTLNNCFNSTADLANWISGTRQPGSSNRLLVEIGAGDFSRLDLACSGWGYTAFSGAGRGTTKIAGAGFSGCNELVFKHLTIDNTSIAGAPAAVTWAGAATPTNSQWDDVELIGKAYGWYQQNDSGGTCSDAVAGNSGKHYWSSSRIVAKGGSLSFVLAYRDACGSENWFFGSELLAESKTSFTYEISALDQDGKGDSHFYGSVIRVIANASIAPDGGVFCLTSDARPLVAAVCASAGSVHIHGTGIDVISNVAGNSIAALVAGPTARVHANGTAYNLSSSGGAIARIWNNGGHVHAPYMWEQHSTPPSISTDDGADVAVVTTPTGPRMVISNAACSSKWFDVGANDCQP